MSSYPPPTYVVPIYNPAYFASSTEGLTLGEASGIFLNKTSPDIATALETFNAGINTNTIQATNPATGSISIGTSQTDGILNLGAGTARTTAGDINIGNSASLNTIKIDTASTLNALATPAIAIGTSASKKTICIGNNTAVSNNTVFLGNCEVVTSSGGVEINNGNSTMYLGNKQTSAVLNVGTQAGITRGSSATVNIANQSSNTCAVNVMCGGATVGGSVNIANQGANSTVVNIGSATSTGNFNLNTCGTINIGTDNTTVANTINIGATNTVISQVFCRATFTVSRAFLCSALFTVNGNANFGSTITLQSSTTPTQDTMLGGTRSGTLSLTNPPVLATVLATMTLTVAGTYLFNFNLQIPTSVKGTENSIGLTGVGANTVRYGANNADTTFTGFNGSQVVVATATTYTLIFIGTNSTFSGLVTGYFTATRIA